MAIRRFRKYIGFGAFGRRGLPDRMTAHFTRYLRHLRHCGPRPVSTIDRPFADFKS